MAAAQEDAESCDFIDDGWTGAQRLRQVVLESAFLAAVHLRTLGTSIVGPFALNSTGAKFGHRKASALEPPIGQSVFVMMVRRLGPGDETVLRDLAENDTSFDLDERHSDALAVLDAGSASEYLSDPAVLHWGAFDGDAVIGHLLCFVERRRSLPARQILLYEIGVHTRWRRKGVGRALVDEMAQWMKREQVSEVWVLADNPGAEEFYSSCGFERDPVQPTQMSRRIRP